MTACEDADEEAHRDPRGPEERVEDAAGRGAVSRPLLREPVTLVDVEIVAREGTAEEQATVVMAFDEPDVSRPLVVGLARAVSRGGVRPDSGLLAIESDHCNVEGPRCEPYAPARRL